MYVRMKKLKGKQTYSSTPDSDRKQTPAPLREHFETIIKDAAYM